MKFYQSLIPIFIVFKVIYLNGIPLKKIKWIRLIPWILKCILFSPIGFFEYCFYNKKILNTEIVKPPIFILGHWRSGTTMLHQLVLTNIKYSYINTFFSIFPSEAILLTPFKGLFNTVFKKLKIVQKIIRYDFSFDIPSEEDIALANLGLIETTFWAHFIPHKNSVNFRKYLDIDAKNLDVEKWKKNYLYLLKKATFLNKSKQLILKNPANTNRVNVLNELFPDAKFIFINRDKDNVIKSTLNLWNVLNLNYSFCLIEKIDYNYLTNLVYNQTFLNYNLHKNCIKNSNLLELEYEKIVIDETKYLKIIMKFLASEYNYSESKLKTLLLEFKNYKNNKLLN